MRQAVWVVEYRESRRQPWRPTRGCCLKRDEARTERDGWLLRHQTYQARVMKYERMSRG